MECETDLRFKILLLLNVSLVKGTLSMYNLFVGEKKQQQKIKVCLRSHLGKI